MNARLVRSFSLVLLSAILSACAGSPPVRYYTLVSSETLPMRRAAGSATPAYLLDVVPVSVPPQADQPQIMVQQGDGAVTPFYSDRWTAPLGDEIRGALSYSLVRRLGVLDVQTIQAPTSAPVWRVQVDVQRFDAIANGAVVLDATWRIRPINVHGQALLCRSIVTVEIGGATPELAVSAERKATAALAATIATGIQAAGVQARAASPGVRLVGCHKA